MKQIFLFYILLYSSFLFAQESSYCSNPKFEKTIERYISHSIEVIGVDELFETQSNYLVLDARELLEFEISHIPGSKYIGYDKPNLEVLKSVDKNQPIVLYCSIGYRSEKMAEQLQKQGFINVKNLYGSIFEWGNKSYPLEDASGMKTNKIHTYNRLWSKWVENKELEKIY